MPLTEEQIIQIAIGAIKKAVDAEPAAVPDMEPLKEQLAAASKAIAAAQAIVDTETVKVVSDTITVTNPSTPPIVTPIPPSLEPPAEKKSKWAKVGGFFKKVWPVASIGLLAVPGGAAIAAGVNAVMGAGTADPTTAGVAGLIVPVATAIVKGMQKE